MTDDFQESAEGLALRLFNDAARRLIMRVATINAASMLIAELAKQHREIAGFHECLLAEFARNSRARLQAAANSSREGEVQK